MTTQTSPSAPTGRSPTPSGGAPRLPRIRTVLLSAVSTSSVSGARPGDVLPRGGGDGPSPESRLNGSRHRGDGPTPRGNTEKGCSRRSWSGCGTTVPGRGPTSLSTRRPRSAAAPWTSASPASVKRSVTRQRVYVIVCRRCPVSVARPRRSSTSSGSCAAATGDTTSTVVQPPSPTTPRYSRRSPEQRDAGPVHRRGLVLSSNLDDWSTCIR